MASPSPTPRTYRKGIDFLMKLSTPEQTPGSGLQSKLDECRKNGKLQIFPQSLSSKRWRDPLSELSQSSDPTSDQSSRFPSSNFLPLATSAISHRARPLQQTTKATAFDTSSTAGDPSQKTIITSQNTGIRSRRTNFCFSPKEFSKINNERLRREDVQDILEKDPGERNNSDIKKLASFFKQVRFFKERNISQQGIELLSQYFKLVQKPMGTNAIAHGETGSEFFIILKGSVEVMVPNSNIKGWTHQRFKFMQEQNWKKAIDEKFQTIVKSELKMKEAANKKKSIVMDHLMRMGKATALGLANHAQSEEQPPRKASSRNLKGSDAMDVNFNFHRIVSQFNSQVQERQNEQLFEKLELSREEISKYRRIQRQAKNAPKWFILLTKLKAGESFGELALLSDSIRAATVTCVEDCVFATIDRDNFEEVLGSVEHKKVMRKVGFFTNLSFLKHWTKNQLMKASHSFYEQEFKRNQFLYKQGTPADQIFILKKGQLQVERRCVVPLPNDLDPAQEKKAMKQFLSTSNPDQSSPKGDVFNKMQLLQKKKEALNFVVKTFEAGQMLGEDDAVQDRLHVTSVKCLSETCQVYCIKKEEFTNKFQRDELSWEQILKDISLKDKFLKLQIITQVKSRQKQKTPQPAKAPEAKQPCSGRLPIKRTKACFSPLNQPLKEMTPRVSVRDRGKVPKNLTPLRAPIQPLVYLEGSHQSSQLKIKINDYVRQAVDQKEANGPPIYSRKLKAFSPEPEPGFRKFSVIPQPASALKPLNFHATDAGWRGSPNLSIALHPQEGKTGGFQQFNPDSSVCYSFTATKPTLRAVPNSNKHSQMPLLITSTEGNLSTFRADTVIDQPKPLIPVQTLTNFLPTSGGESGTAMTATNSNISQVLLDARAKAPFANPNRIFESSRGSPDLHTSGSPSPLQDQIQKLKITRKNRYQASSLKKGLITQKRTEPSSPQNQDSCHSPEVFQFMSSCDFQFQIRPSANRQTPCLPSRK